MLVDAPPEVVGQRDVLAQVVPQAIRAQSFWGAPPNPISFPSLSPYVALRTPFE
jgi:hypothetical protein